MSQNQKGFTIIELMIATLVFSMVLLIISSALIEIGRIYYKGITVARTQETARSIVDDIEQAIQFNGGTIVTSMTNGSVKGFCVGNKRYSFLKSVQLDGGQNRVFVSDAVAAGCGGSTLPMSTAQLNTPLVAPGQELVANKMRIVKATVTSRGAASPLYDISVRVAYGSDAGLCSPSVSGQCSDPSNTTVDVNKNDLQCKNVRTSSQFCAVSEINTTASRRL